MQTFLPYSNYRQSMSVLDPSRLGNQVYREGLTILRGGWKHHPASKMWAAHRHQLISYLLDGLIELEKRGKFYPHIRGEIYDLSEEIPQEEWAIPPWLGDPDFHASHRSNLLRKDPEWYGQFGWIEPDNLPYVWPVR